MQALSIVKMENEPTDDLQLPELPEIPVQKQESQADMPGTENLPVSPKEAGKEKIKEHYATFSRQFQERNLDQCPMVGYSIHWIYSQQPQSQV